MLLPCDLKFGCRPGEEVAGEDYVHTLRQRMDDIHQRVRLNIQSASDRMKEHYDIQAEHGGYQPGKLVWLYNPQRRRGLSPKLQSSWEGPYEVMDRINDVVYRIRKLPKGKPRIVHFNRLSPYQGEIEDRAGTVRTCSFDPPDSEMSFDDFMARYNSSEKARYGVTKEDQRDLFSVPPDYSLAHCVARDLRMSRGIAATFNEKFGRVGELRRQDPEVGSVLRLTDNAHGQARHIFYLVTKEWSPSKPTYLNLWKTLIELREALLNNNIARLAIPKLACGLDGLSWRTIRNMIEVLFRFTGIEILICCYNSKLRSREKTVDCYFYQTSQCTRGQLCKNLHSPCTSRDEHVPKKGAVLYYCF